MDRGVRGSESEGTVGLESEQRPQLSSIDQCCQLFQPKKRLFLAESVAEKQKKYYGPQVMQ